MYYGQWTLKVKTITFILSLTTQRSRNHSLHDVTEDAISSLRLVTPLPARPWFCSLRAACIYLLQHKVSALTGSSKQRAKCAANSRESLEQLKERPW